MMKFTPYGYVFLVRFVYNRLCNNKSKEGDLYAESKSTESEYKNPDAKTKNRTKNIRG